MGALHFQSMKHILTYNICIKYVSQMSRVILGNIQVVKVLNAWYVYAATPLITLGFGDDINCINVL